MLNFEKVFSQIKKSVENDFLEVPYKQIEQIVKQVITTY